MRRLAQGNADIDEEDVIIVEGSAEMYVCFSTSWSILIFVAVDTDALSFGLENNLFLFSFLDCTHLTNFDNEYEA